MKIIGYIISIIGLLILSLAILPKLKAKIPQLSGIPDITLIIISVAIVLIGIFIISKSPKSSSKIKELPIYHGKEVVGYRRTR